MHLSLLTTLFFFSAPVFAQTPNDWVMQDSLVENLEDAVNASVRAKIQFGVGQDDEIARVLGELLLEEVQKQVIPYLTKYYLPETKPQAIARFIQRFYKSIDPFKLGKWILKQGRIHGPVYVATYSVLEIAEKTLMYLAVFYPKLVVLYPAMRLHPAETITFVLGPMVPRAFDRLKVWSKTKEYNRTWRGKNARESVGLWGDFGGGVYGYYTHLLRQRQMLPIDWDVVIDTKKIATTSAETGADSIEFAIINESWLQSKLPHAVKILFSPKRQAQKETMPTVSVRELEKMCNWYGINVKRFSVFKSNMKVYAQELVQQLLSNEWAARRLGEWMSGRKNLVVGSGRRIPLDASLFLKLSSERMREVAEQDYGESLDVVAQRVSWYLKDKTEYLANLAIELQPKGMSGTQRKLIRKIAALVGREKGLAGFVTYDYTYSSNGDWEKFTMKMHEANGFVIALEESLPLLPGRCEALLSAPAYQ